MWGQLLDVVARDGAVRQDGLDFGRVLVVEFAVQIRNEVRSLRGGEAAELVHRPIPNEQCEYEQCAAARLRSRGRAAAV